LNNVNDQILDLYPAHNISGRRSHDRILFVSIQIRRPIFGVYPGVGATLQRSL
jgi:hypothetical protein